MSELTTEEIGLATGRGGPIPAVAVSGGLAILAAVLGWHGGDLAAQVFRADLFRHYGFVLWNNLWFGGHATLDYSVLVPMIGSIIGPVIVGAIAAVASAYCVERLLRSHFGASAAAGALWFAVSTVTNIAVGRVTFSVGVALGLVALLGLQRDRAWIAGAFGLLCTLASPVAGVFLAIATVAWGSRQRSRVTTTAMVLVTTIVPLAVVALQFPGSGVFPFEPWLLAGTLLACTAVLWALPRDQVVLRRGVGLYAVACLADFAVPNALGGNITRLAQYGAGPLLACALWPARRRALALMAVPLLAWQWVPAFDGIALAGRDPSTRASYYAPLVAFLHRQPSGPRRIEIPVTRHHWESVYIGDTQPLARGWERQLDMSFNEIFYEGTLTAGEYERWLTNMGVDFVALPRAPLDDTSMAEAKLLDAGLPYLTPVWHNRDWQVWRYRASPGLVSGPATLTKLAPDSFTVNVSEPGDVVVRVRTSGHWRVPEPGCFAPTADGWTMLRGLPVGVDRITQSLRGTPCD